MREDKLSKIFNKCLKFFHINISDKNEKSDKMIVKTIAAEENK